MSKQDLRITRTKTMIFNAFIDLIEKKGFDSITIQDIADQAMINRSTFYAHFKDKQDVYEHIFSFILNPLFKKLEQDILEDGSIIQEQKLVELLTTAFLMIKENKKFYLIATEGRNNLILTDAFSDFLRNHYTKIFAKLRVEEDDIVMPTDFIISYMVSTFMGTIHWWLHSDFELPPEHMAHLIIKLLHNGNLTVLGIKVKK
ncbi:TetR/AcrR family transcriptional regulator [Liquorilactobacillus uvarum]|uniref:TetR family transcriptional regulator n=1 Tax=Liquorilactobacillus uvarum DSM 19971 TaxID=1423812 RepID=A0A0R1PPC9_9LACO|nr:TetR/AcrR family transcriptional regulator [Liquorilactobacillus uvarum]KRL34406.1 TetR family transcriptional regulator [Liquorilactobacillus uvarum DSM 19971]